MVMVQSEKILTTQEYCEKYFASYHPVLKGKKDELRIILDLWGFEEIWDRPLSEIDEVVESGSPVVLVDCSYSENRNLVKEYRWFELP